MEQPSQWAAFWAVILVLFSIIIIMALMLIARPSKVKPIRDSPKPKVAWWAPDEGRLRNVDDSVDLEPDDIEPEPEGLPRRSGNLYTAEELRQHLDPDTVVSINKQPIGTVDKILGGNYD